jgi:hypothetical protein
LAHSTRAGGSEFSLLQIFTRREYSPLVTRREYSLPVTRREYSPLVTRREYSPLVTRREYSLLVGHQLLGSHEARLDIDR